MDVCDAQLACHQLRNPNAAGSVALRDRVAGPEALLGPASEVTITAGQFEAVLNRDRGDVRVRDEPNGRLRG
jgi:hypothetical protein